MMKTVAAAGLAALALSACATKRYPIATPFSTTEASLMTCRELALESVKVDEVQKQIEQKAEFDVLTVAGFLGDFGTGNRLARSEAMKAMWDRRHAINDTMAKKGCSAAPTELGASS